MNDPYTYTLIARYYHLIRWQRFKRWLRHIFRPVKTIPLPPADDDGWHRITIAKSVTSPDVKWSYKVRRISDDD